MYDTNKVLGKVKEHVFEGVFGKVKEHVFEGALGKVKEHVFEGVLVYDTNKDFDGGGRERSY